MELLPTPLPQEPMQLLNAWVDEAMTAKAKPNPNAMSLATVKNDGQPSVRVVLAKEINTEAGYLVFYTNYDSPKGNEIAQNPRAAISMHWDYAGRQIRGEGLLVKSPESESDRYFASRDRGSQVGAWASLQSQPVESREALKARFAAAQERFSGADVPRPPHWGGYRLWLTTVELWLSRESRLHDRAKWTRTVEPGTLATTSWNCCGRLQP